MAAQASWIGLVVSAYGKGGATEAGIVAGVVSLRLDPRRTRAAGWMPTPRPRWP